MSEELDELLRSIPCLWKGSPGIQEVSNVLSTGYEQLDQLLPSAGWPSGVVIELLPEAVGIGELSLMLPVIKTLMGKQCYVVMINAPHIPYAPALRAAGVDLKFLLLMTPDNLRDAVWAAEKALQNSICGMVLLWSGGCERKNNTVFNSTVIRRLQVAAQQNNSILVLYQFSSWYRHNGQNPWAAVRFGLSKVDNDLVVDVLKTQGTCKRHRIRLNLEKERRE